MREIGFDESGNSGQNLLDPVQPVYVLASVNIEESEAHRLIGELKEESVSAELKFAQLRTGKRGRELIDELLHVEMVRANSRAVPVSKEWMIAGKLVDTLIEPGVGDPGGFYASGVHRRIADAFYAQGSAEVGLESWRELQRSFVAAIRSPKNQAKTSELADAIRSAKIGAGESAIGILLEMVPEDPRVLSEMIPDGPDELDPALGGLVEQLHHWSQRLEEPFRVVHDDSGVVERWRKLLERLSDSEVERTVLEVGEAKFVFPLMAPEISVVDSEHSATVQIADVIAGAVCWCLRERVLGKEMPAEWVAWDLENFIDFAQGPPDFLLGLVDPTKG
jgi:hypothetical protein